MSRPSRYCGETASTTILSNPGWSRSDSAGPITGQPLPENPLASHSSPVGILCEGSRPMLRNMHSEPSRP